MVFSSTVFLFLFLPVALAVYYSPICKRLVVKNIWLLMISLVFYAWGEPLFVLLMILSIIMNYLFGRIIANSCCSNKGKIVVGVACIYNLGMLFVFKYMGWIAGLCGVSENAGIRQIVLPIGISFYTFQALSYVIDVYRGKEEVQKSILNVGLYIAFFPQLVAGPIVRYGSIEEQLKERNHNFDLFSEGVWRFLIGLSKKTIIANHVAVVAEQAFAKEGTELSVVFAWVGALAFMLQIYFDFSGYSDMAIGLGKMFGFHFSENFNYPYMSKSITEFWRRWHMSLGEWFRDYVYFPLGGSRVSVGRHIGNLFVVWFLTGVWHGANLTFVVWGLGYFLLLVIEKYIVKPNNLKKWASFVWQMVTLISVYMGWIVFNSQSLSHAGNYYLALFHGNGNMLIDESVTYWFGQYKVFLIVGVIFAFPVVEKIKDVVVKKGKIVQYSFKTLQGIVMIGLLVLNICYVMASGYNPFIYFNF